jgi:hypothetical protein
MAPRTSIASNMTTASIKSSYSSRMNPGKMFGITAFTSISLIVLFVIIGTIVALSMNTTKLKKSDEKYQANPIVR